jgi:hypothetical protein
LLAALDDLDLESGDTRDHEITHTLPFKCIGAAHEKEYQESLEQAHHVLHEQKKDVAVRPEPNNINLMMAMQLLLIWTMGQTGKWWDI